MFIEFRAVKNTWPVKVTFYTVLLQINSGNCLQKNWPIQEYTSDWLSYCKTNKGAVFMPHSVELLQLAE